MSSYTALYRKWRPRRFEDVKGQDAIVQTLKNQITTGRIGHAYLFCGTRGTGKTTVAKILAKAVNCENPVDGSPCLSCSTCLSIAEGASMNVVEIDAASNNGVDNVRDIIEDVAYSPAMGKYKVYIIDEVHMLSPGAFNALLKTLEEPPEYAIFILATTEAHRIPVTILSRCQRYDFKRISNDIIVERLKEMMAGEEIRATDEALQYIARLSDGALRDAISLLDQCSAFYYGQELTYEKALNVLGAVDTEVFSELVRDLISCDVKGAIGVLDEITAQGRELSQFVQDLTWYLRNLLLIGSSDQPGMETALDISAENLARLKEEAALLPQEGVMRYIRILSELSGQLRFASQKRVLLEIAIIKLCRPAMESDEDSVLERVRVLEEELSRLTEFVRKIQENPSALSTVSFEAETPPAETEVIPLPEQIEKNVILAGQKRDEIMSHLTNMMRHILSGAVWSAKEKDKLLIVPKNPLTAGFVKDEVFSKNLDEAITKVIGAHVDFEIKMPESGSRIKKQYTELHSIEGIDMEIIEEE